MKAKTTLVIALLITIASFAQQGINYKAVIKDDLGNLVTNQSINVRFSVQESNGTDIYIETHTTTTDANGIIIVNIGEGTNPSSDFSEINWSGDEFQLQTEIDLTGSYVIVGNAAPFKAVPYALSSADNTWSKNGGNTYTSSEKVGIGTNTPTQLLSIMDTDNASIKLETDAYTDTTAVRFENGPKNALFVHYRIESTNDSLKIRTESSFTGPDIIDLLKISHSGSIIAPELKINDIHNNAKALVTKEYFDSQASYGLKAINQGNGIGRRLAGFNTSHYGIIGESAIDLSDSGGSVNSTRGATGDYSIATGYGTTSTGDYSIAMGNLSSAVENGSIALGSSAMASGVFSTAIGRSINANSFSETVIGTFNTDYTPNNTTSWDENDRLFVIGNGASLSNRSNALIILKNGTITAPSFDISEITQNRSLITKEYADTNYLNADGNVTTGGSLTIQNASDATSSWRFSTQTNGSLSIFRNGAYRGFFSASTGNYSSISDRRAKKNITTLDSNTLDKVMQLNPVSYLMNDQTDTKRNMGLISQEVQEIFPTLTSYVDGQDLLALSYTELIPILIKALQEQQSIIETQKAKDVVQDKTIKDQGKSIKELVARLNLIESKSSN